MKNMDFLEQLLDGQKVEWKKLGEVCNVLRGRRLTKKDMIEDGEYLVYQNSMIPLGRYNKYNVKGGTTYVICAGSAGEIGYSSEDFWAADDVSYFECPEFVHSKFLYYYLLTQQQRILRQVRKAGVPRLAPDVLRQLLIPLPSLFVQSRIVEILDKFTSLEAELEAELDCRKRQYIYYRELLLDFSDENKYPNVEWKKLGEVAEYIRGVTYNKKAETQDEDSWVVLRANNIDIDSRQLCFDDLKRVVRTTRVRPNQYLQVGDILICAGSGSKQHIGKTAYIGEELGYTFGGFMGVIRCDDSVVLPRFLFHYLGSVTFREYLEFSLYVSTINNLNSTIMNAFPIPLPPLSEQARIVEILDKFDTLTNSITEGLPLEIKLRKQQYEYYREQLLDFRRF